MNKEATDVFGNAVNQHKVNGFYSKHVKFEMLIKEIEAKLPGDFGVTFGGRMGVWGNPLFLVFDKDTANPYRRTILEKAKFQIQGFLYSESVLEDRKKKIEATKKFIEATKEIAEYFGLGEGGNPSLLDAK